MWRNGRARIAENFGVSRHTLWRFLERGHVGRSLPRAVLNAVGVDIDKPSPNIVEALDAATAPLVKEMFESSLRGNCLREICKEFNERGITNRGKRWYKSGLNYLLTNEAYTGTAVWGRTSRGEKAQDPVRVEGAWPALVSRDLFDAVQQAMRERAPNVQRPGRVGSKFLLSGLLRCGVCGMAYIGHRGPRAASSPTTSAARCIGRGQALARPGT